PRVHAFRHQPCVPRRLRTFCVRSMAAATPAFVPRATQSVWPRGQGRLWPRLSVAVRSYPTSKVRSVAERSYPTSKVRSVAVRSYPTSKVRSVAVRSYPTSKVRAAERSYPTSKVPKKVSPRLITPRRQRSSPPRPSGERGPVGVGQRLLMTWRSRAGPTRRCPRGHHRGAEPRDVTLPPSM
ncbi:unnamed protein product, partial [Rangifer tarandus platyrhynchus]